MKTKEILDYVLYGAVDVEKFVKFEACAGDNFAMYLPELCDDTECEPGEYFSFWSSDADCETDKEILLRFSESKVIDYEMPTKDGYWIIVKFED